MDVKYRFGKWILGLAASLMLGLGACQSAQPLATPLAGETGVASATETAPPIQLPSPTPAPTQSPTPEATNTPAPSPTPTAVFYEPAGCWQPPDDYTHVQANGHTLNARTLSMLQQAALLYGGEIDVTGAAIVQGSYGDYPLGEPEAHLGGGVVDISVVRPNTSAILYMEIEPLIRALRTVGFAAWLREAETESGLGFHIHAVAIGDAELSPAAQDQLTGPAGYLRGGDGLAAVDSEASSDKYGGPLICRWMLEAGYTDLRPPTAAPTPSMAWQERLRLASLAYQAFYPEDAEQIARSLDFLEGENESAENICGPLAAAILRDAGLLPNQPGPIQDLKSFWQARPITNGRPWNMFPERDYEVFHYDTPLAEFDFIAWPLQPGDFLYTYAEHSGFEHMFVVTEVDAEGRAYTVTNQNQSWGNDIWGSMLILRYMLYDPTTPGAGIIYNEWSDRRLGLTGHAGFDVLRRRGLEAGSTFEYTVRPGDTLPELAVRFGTALDLSAALDLDAALANLVQANPGLDLYNLQVGQLLTISIPPYTPSPSEPAANQLP